MFAGSRDTPFFIFAGEVSWIYKSSIRNILQSLWFRSTKAITDDKKSGFDSGSKTREMDGVSKTCSAPSPALNNGRVFFAGSLPDSLGGID